MSTTDIPDLFPDLPDPATPAQIVEATPWARRTLDRHIASGRLPAYRLGNRLLIRKSDLLGLVEKVRAAS